MPSKPPVVLVVKGNSLHDEQNQQLRLGLMWGSPQKGVGPTQRMDNEEVPLEDMYTIQVKYLSLIHDVGDTLKYVLSGEEAVVIPLEMIVAPPGLDAKGSMIMKAATAAIAVLNVIPAITRYSFLPCTPRVKENDRWVYVISRTDLARVEAIADDFT